MKHAVALVLVIIFAFGLTGCGKTAYEPPQDQSCSTGDTPQEPESTDTDIRYELPDGRFCTVLIDLTAPQDVELKTADKEYIIKVLNDSSWINDLSKCLWDFVFYTKDQTIRYTSHCGTFDDITNHRTMNVPEETRIAINKILGVN